MAQGDVITTVVGNLTGDPELRFTQSGQAVVNFTVASTPRFLNRETNQWEDGDAFFLRCNQWRQPAENVAESYGKGDRVIVTGRLKQRSFETREGEKRTVVEMEVDEIGASTKFRTVKIDRAQRQAQGQRGGAPADDPWGSPPPPPSPTGYGSGFSDEPPF